MNTNLYLNPGPIDESLLYLGAEHRARNLFLNPQEGGRCTMDFKRGDGTFWEQVYDNRITLTGRVLRNIGLFGFGGVIRCSYRRVDRALIEALVERWRPKTNTFHMPFGEATVTLEDVNVLWGLPIEGQALAGYEGSFDHGGTARYLVDGLGYIGQEATRMQNMGPDNYYENFAGLQGMASQLIGSVNHIERPTYIQTHEPDLGPDSTIPQHAPLGRGRRGRQRTRVDHVHDNVGEGLTNFSGPAANYGEGPSNFGGSTPNYGEGPSNFGGANLQADYRPSFENVGEGSSNIQLGTQNNWVSSLFDYTPDNMIPAMYTSQTVPYQNYDYTGLSVQQPRYQHLTPVQMSLDLQQTQPESFSPPINNDLQDPEPRRVQPRRHPKPVGCGTGGCLINYPHRH